MNKILILLVLFVGCDMSDILGVADDDHTHSGVCGRVARTCNGNPPSCITYRCYPNYSQIECEYAEADEMLYEDDDVFRYDWYLDMTCEEFCASIPENLEDDNGTCTIFEDESPED